MTTKPRTRNTKGRFTKGTSGNLAGRPPGSRNRATLLMEELLAGESERLIRKAVELALDGDVHAMKLCLERVHAPCKDQPIHLTLPPIENAQQVSSAMSVVVGAIGDGRITPSEGEILANILAVQNNVLTAGDLERRVEQLEQVLSTHKDAVVDQGAADVAQILRKGRSPSEVDRDQ